MADDGSASNPRDPVKSSVWNVTWIFNVIASFIGEFLRKLFGSLLPKELDRKRSSRIAIVVFSKNYASSTWCLTELVEIHKCYKELNRIMVIPIFYKVDPSHIRKQTGDFGKAFEETCKGKPEDQTERWKQALEDVANLAGEHIHNMCNEADMIEKIANYVWNKLTPPSDDFGDLVGIEAHLEAINPMFCLESEEAIMVGVLGPSGIGKTIIARALFSKLSTEFHHRAFVSYQSNGDIKLYWEQQFLSEILGQKDLRICDLGMVKQKLKHMKVLIVLDDVNNLELLKTLAGQTGWFGPGSRIIVITQDRWLLKAHKIDRIYEVEFPSEVLALKMLCRSAFDQNSPPGGFMELAVEVARLAGNLPLGLRVLGSSLKGRDKDEWIEMLPRFRNDLDGDIEKVLRVGYDRLHWKDQELFLYLAFACKHVTYIRDFVGDSDDTSTGLKMLADKSLIRITPEYDIEMHNLLQSLGREIVRAESISKPGERRFLEDVEDIRNVLANKTGTETVLGIRLNTSDLNQPLYMHKKAFKHMHNLQFLIICTHLGLLDLDWEGTQLPSLDSISSLIQNDKKLKLRELNMEKCSNLTYLPRKLKLLIWDECPLKCLPSNFKTEFLVELRMENSKLEKLWEGTQPLRSLKRMNMSGSRYLKEIPDLSNAINLEELNLSICESLVTLPTLLKFKSLEEVNLKGCFRLRNFPQINLTTTWGNYEIKVEDCLWNKNLHGVDYLDNLKRCIPSQFLRLEHLRYLTVENSMLEKLWEGVQSLGSLKKMNLSECGNLKEIPDLSKATNLWSLKLNNCKSLVTVPSTIGNLQELKELKMKGCTGLEVLPTDVNLSSLDTLDLSGCKRLRSFPQISWSIKSLNLNDTAIEEVPSTIGNLNQLIWLYMEGCTGLEVLPTDANLSSLRILTLSGCKRLRSFPQISWSIKSLYLNDTAIEEVPCCIEKFSRLTKLSMRGCKRLKNISPNIFRLRGLERADFSECTEVVTALGDASVVETPEDRLSLLSGLISDCCRSIEDSWEFILRSSFRQLYSNPALGDDFESVCFKFNNCYSLDGDARELILRSCSKPTLLPGGRVPKYFTHQSSRHYLTVTLPQSSLSQEFLRFKACVVVEPITNPKDYAPYLGIRWYFRGGWQHIYLDLAPIYNTDHLVSIPLNFWNIAPQSEFDYNDVKLEFSVMFKHANVYKLSPFQRIKGFGIRVMEMSPSPASSDGSKKPMLSVITSEEPLQLTLCSTGFPDIF